MSGYLELVPTLKPSKNIYFCTIGISNALSLTISTAYLFDVGIGDTLGGNRVYDVFLNHLY